MCLRVFCGFIRFKQIYIADLDAIEKRGEHSGLISQLAGIHPQYRILG